MQNNNVFSQSVSLLTGVTPNIQVLDRLVPNANGVTKAIYFEGQPYNGRTTQTFAYIGVPSSPMPEGGYPAVVAVHGGGGCAFYEWVEYWNGKGYACITPDITGRKDGCVKLDCNRAPVNESGGPMGYRPFGTTFDNYKDAWFFHGVSNVVLASQVLRADDRINANEIALTGISWGSVLSMVACGIDHRFCAFAPVYGGGYIHTTPMFLAEDNPPEDVSFWLANFDPVAYIPKIKCPTLFSCGANEPAFMLGNNIRSYGLCKNASFSWREDLAHYHRWRDGEGMICVYRFFQKVINGEPMPFEILRESMDGRALSLTLSGDLDGVTAKLLTCENDVSSDSRSWKWNGESLKIKDGEVVANVPLGVTACFVEITDNKENAFVLSSKAYEF